MDKLCKDKQPEKKDEHSNARKYIKAGHHICPKSPTGSHHWAEGSLNQIPGVKRGDWACQHCGEVRGPSCLPRSWEGDAA